MTIYNLLSPFSLFHKIHVIHFYLFFVLRVLRILHIYESLILIQFFQISLLPPPKLTLFSYVQRHNNHLTEEGPRIEGPWIP